MATESTAKQTTITSANRERGPTTRCRGRARPNPAATARSPIQPSTRMSRVTTRARPVTSASRPTRAPTVIRLDRGHKALAGTGPAPLPPLPGIDRRDLVGVLLQHDAPLHLQRGRDLAGLLGPVPGQHAEHLDPLGVRDRTVRLLHGGLQVGPQRFVLTQVGDAAARRPAVLGQPCRPRVVIDGEQYTDERLPVA